MALVAARVAGVMAVDEVGGWVEEEVAPRAVPRAAERVVVVWAEATAAVMVEVKAGAEREGVVMEVVMVGDLVAAKEVAGRAVATAVATVVAMEVARAVEETGAATVVVVMVESKAEEEMEGAATAAVKEEVMVAATA